MLPSAPLLRVRTGDSPSHLLAALDAEAKAMPLGPLADEIIVVQSLGMDRWVRQQLARRRGAAASLRLPFPAAFCRELATALHVGLGVDPGFDEAALTWRLAALLEQPAAASDPTFAPLATYLNNADAAKRYGLARRIAARFDEYRLYRPDVLLAWERGERPVDSVHADWQAALWRALVADVGEGGATPRHFARWFADAIRQLEQATVAPPGLPARVSVFGVSTLPPLFVQLLGALARFVPVTVYVLTPSANGWHDAAHRHPLEDAFGATARELLTQLAPDSRHVMHLASPLPVGDTLLARVQRALRTGQLSAARELVDSDDRSLLVHECHSSVRELEVLRDHLLDAFAADESLRPHDVLVMVPDVERYAPLAAVVFGDPVKPATDGSVTIPYRIADRALARDASAARALEQVLALAGSRFLASEVLDLLTLAPVQRAAGIAPAQLEQVVTWVQEAAIRWGRDGLDRGALGLPSLEDFTWRQGLDRLLAGYAAGRVESLVEGVMPVAGDTVGDAALLGAFVEWVDVLIARVEALRAPRPLAAWSRTLQETLAWLVAPDTPDERRAYERVHRELERLARTAGEPLGASAARPVPFDVARRWLAGALAGDEHDTGFLTGRLTLCAMKPMRAIPFKVIAVLGLDDRAFPRRERRAAFDLIEAAPLAGDRKARADDRQLFLDTVLCAGHRLHLSWVGRSQQNNAEIAPSVVIAELLDHLDAHYDTVRPDPTIKPGDPQPLRNPVRAHVLVSHFLQPFNPAYFTGDDSRRFSFDATWARSVAAAETPQQPVPFHAAPYATANESRPTTPSPLPTLVTLADLIDAWCNPARFHCRRVLQLHLSRDGDVIEDVEPTGVARLDRYALHQGMLERLLRGDVHPERDARLATASGQLPPGALAPAWYDALREEFDVFAAALGQPTFRDPLAVAVDGPTWRLVGRLEGQVDGGQLRVRAAQVRPADRVQAWIAHLAYAAMGGHGTTHVRGMKGDSGFTPLGAGEAVEVLDALIGGYRRLLEEPLPYFPHAGAAYWAHIDDPARAALKARAGFKAVTDFDQCDLADPYVALLWRGRDPLGEAWDAFVHWCTVLWSPLAEAEAAYREERAAARRALKAVDA